MLWTYLRYLPKVYTYTRLGTHQVMYVCMYVCTVYLGECVYSLYRHVFMFLRGSASFNAMAFFVFDQILTRRLSHTLFSLFLPLSLSLSVVARVSHSLALTFPRNLSPPKYEQPMAQLQHSIISY
ncbi:hypothetical protein F5B20DRAFT_7838 [Whalleya microplaca]|nr:hypothetical protein F5B20DRAFT_7838 [Whalleya microplaca]